MKGLLRNNFYSVGTNLQTSFAISLVLVLLPLILGGNIIAMVLSTQLVLFIANIGTALHTDVVSKWDKFEITMPVRRSDVIRARYLSFLMIILCGILMALSTLVVSLAFGVPLAADLVTFGLSFGIFLALMLSALMYPIMLKIGTEKNEIIVLVCAGLAVAVLCGIALLTVPPTGDTVRLSRKPLVLLIANVVAIAMFVGSYFLSLRLYQQKEL